MTELDLSALDTPLSLNEINTNDQTGKPKEIPIKDIERNPHNPRRTFDKKSLEELAKTIAEHGVSSPVSVQPHPTLEGKWQLNFGERRLIASEIAGKDTIPSIITNTLTDFELVIENIQREMLAPIDIANFIQSKLSEGFKAAAIANHLGKSKSFINEHIALIDPPTCIMKLYSDGKTSSPRTIYDLRKLFEKKPEQVEKWCETTEDVSRSAVNALKNELENSTVSQQPGDKKGETPPARKRDPNTVDLENNISDKVGLPVILNYGENGKGSIKFKYFSLDELEGLLDQLNIER